MTLGKKLTLLRKQNGLSQEQLAEKLGIARQTVSKWETGQAIPELDGLISLSNLYGTSIDRIVKNEKCNLNLSNKNSLLENERNKLISFLIKAKRNTYAGHGSECTESRPKSHDLQFTEDDFFYYDTYLGSEKFSGEEAVWKNETPIWSMNYYGRVIAEHFSGDFLKEALFNVPYEKPFRGPEIFTQGDYTYHCKVDGDFEFFQGYEDIFYLDKKIYELYFHGGIIL